MFRCLNCAGRLACRPLGSSRKLGGAAEHLIDGSEKRICRLSIKCYIRMLLEGAVIVILREHYCQAEVEKLFAILETSRTGVARAVRVT